MFTLDTAEQFYIHLGMTGRLTVEPADAEVMKHTHLIAVLDNGRPLRFRDARRFGGISVARRADIQRRRRHGLGPRAAARASRSAKDAIGPAPVRTIKTALLDQRLIAGLGNIYVDESLFLAGIHPTRPACELTEDDVKRLTGR